MVDNNEELQADLDAMADKLNEVIESCNIMMDRLGELEKMEEKTENMLAHQALINIRLFNDMNPDDKITPREMLFAILEQNHAS
jgi:hypothetical protein